MKSVSDCGRFKALTGKLTKDWFLCLLKGTVLHLCEDQSFYSSLSKIDEKIDDLQTTTENLAKKFNSVVLLCFPCTGTCKCTETWFEFENRWTWTPAKICWNARKWHQVPQWKIERKERCWEHFKKIGSSVKISQCRRLGKNDEDKWRPILVNFKNVWDKRICFSQALKSKLYNSDRILVLPELSPEDKIIEKKLLAKRYDLINKKGVDKNYLKIRGWKLYNHNQLVSVDWLLTLKLGLLNCRSIVGLSKRLSPINFAHSQIFCL